MKTYTRYSELKKPTWAPPANVFGPVWTALYAVIAVSFGTVFWMTFQGTLAWTIALPFVLNLIFNAAYTPLEFKVKSNMLASIDILLVLGTIVWSMIVIYGEIPWIAYAQVPYLLWVAFATCLQLTITWMNRGR